MDRKIEILGDDGAGSGGRHRRAAGMVALALAAAGMLCLLLGAVIADNRARDAGARPVQAVPP